MKIFKGCTMLFRKQKMDVGTIVEHLGSLGVNQDGESLFLDSDEISKDMVLDFVKECQRSEHAFRFAEDVLRFANAYNALSVLLKLKDGALEGQILARLKDPAFFLTRCKPNGQASRQELQESVEKGFALFIENLEISERLIVIGANEILASRFMNFVSNGRIGKEDDKRIWLAFSLGIYNHLQALRQAVARSKEKLRLK
jgi:hypothetical protein